MGVVALKSDLITKFDNTPWPTPVQSRQAEGYIEGCVGYASKAAGDSATSTYRMVRVHSSWRLRTLMVAIGALGTSGTINVGIYDIPSVNSGAYVNKTLFGSAIDVSAKYRSDVIFDAANADDAVEALWQRLGLTSDPVKFYDIVIELQHAGAGNAVKLSVDVSYQR